LIEKLETPATRSDEVVYPGRHHTRHSITSHMAGCSGVQDTAVTIVDMAPAEFICIHPAVIVCRISTSAL
jgi:hypothetical protein